MPSRDGYLQTVRRGAFLACLLTFNGCGATAPDGLVVELAAPASVTLGASVPLTLRVTNASDRTMIFYGLSDLDAHFQAIVYKPDGTPVWIRIDSQLSGPGRERELLPGAQFVFEAVWPQIDNARQPVGPGQYRIKGFLIGTREAYTPPERTLAIRAP